MAADEQGPPDPDERPTTRRQLLERAGVAGAAALGALLAGRLEETEPAPPRDLPRVAVVGAGLAGLTCAYRLQEAGLHPEVYEASDRVGGRVRTVRDALGENLRIESGGELVDDLDVHVWTLAVELGVELEVGEPPADAAELLHVGGELYPVAEAVEDLDRVVAEPEDGISAAAWIEENVPGGGRSRLGRLLALACAVEHGVGTEAQSAANLRGLLHRARRDPPCFGPWPGTQRVAGGNDELATRMTVELGIHVHPGCELVALELDEGSAGYTLTFVQAGGGTWTAVADQVVLALPPWSLRVVDCTKAGLDPLVLRAIHELGSGGHTKLHLRFPEQHWLGLGCSGRTLADTGSGATWDATPASGGPGVLAALAPGSPQETLRGLEPLLPGVTAGWSGLSHAEAWPRSRSFRAVGQHDAFGTILSERQGGCHLAGEHTSLESPGTMEGAVESGERAAAEILGELE